MCIMVPIQISLHEYRMAPRVLPWIPGYSVKLQPLPWKAITLPTYIIRGISLLPNTFQDLVVIGYPRVCTMNPSSRSPVTGSPIPASMSTAELCNTFTAAMRRSCESKRYSRVYVLFVTWDWNDASSADGLAAVWQLRDLLKESYGYETREVRLPSGQTNGSSYDCSQKEAHDSLKWAVRLFGRGQNARDTLFIFYYFGPARLEPTLESTWSQHGISTRKSMDFVLS
jgi:hypothetical protein